MMVMLNTGEVEEAMVCDAGDLTLKTRHGSRVIAMFDEDVVEGTTEWDGQVGRSTTTRTVVKKVRFLVVNGTPETALEKSRAEVAYLVKDRDTLAAKLKGATSAAERLSADLDTAKTDLRRERDKCTREVADANQRSSKMQRMEGDIAKLRSALGEIKCKEILGQ